MKLVGIMNLWLMSCMFPDLKKKRKSGGLGAFMLARVRVLLCFLLWKNPPELVEDRALWHIFISANEDSEFWVFR